MSDTAALIADVTTVPVFEGFDAALAALYAEHAKPLVEMLWVFVGDRAEAEDLCHEAFVRLHRAWGRIDRDGNVGGYLRATAFNLARSGFRRRLVARRHRPAPEPDGPPADEAMQLRDDQVELLEAVRRLPRRQRECVVLRYWEEQTAEGIAATLGISRNSVKTHLRRAPATEEPAQQARFASETSFFPDNRAATTDPSITALWTQYPTLHQEWNVMTTSPHIIEDPIGPHRAITRNVAQWILADLIHHDTVTTAITDATTAANNVLDQYNSDPARWGRCLPTC